MLDGCFGTAFANPLPSLHPIDLLVGLAIGGILRLAVYIKGKNAKKFRHNQEYGSARWGKHEDIEPYMDPVFQNNVILSQTERLTMNSRPANPKYARNKNTLVVGGSGSGKTRFFIKPNLLQMHSSYVLTDPKVEVFKVKVESTVIAITKAVSKSMCSQLYFFVERRNMLERRKVAL